MAGHRRSHGGLRRHADPIAPQGSPGRARHRAAVGDPGPRHGDAVEGRARHPARTDRWRQDARVPLAHARQAATNAAHWLAGPHLSAHGRARCADYQGVEVALFRPLRPRAGLLVQSAGPSGAWLRGAPLAEGALGHDAPGHRRDRLHARPRPLRAHRPAVAGEEVHRDSGLLHVRQPWVCHDGRGRRPLPAPASGQGQEEPEAGRDGEGAGVPL
mmetsp:Transcript_126877/g.370988  ORF Transcript_126877/g.370988 Transcript_126877/m.370988 type:complete len:215 (-) Transcript_126877:1145-1789(-)